MVSPCQCRGTAEYIHKTCLEEYIRYFPDSVCRVCKFQMVQRDIYLFFSHVLLFFWLSLFISFSKVPYYTKLFYTGLLVFVFFTSISRKLVGHGSLFLAFVLSCVFAVVDGPNLTKLILAIGVIATFVTIGFYVPVEHLMLIATVCLAALYATVLTIFVSVSTDPFMSAYFIGFIAMSWILATRLRPPFAAIT